MGIISWIVLGGIAGWIASLIAGTNARQGLLGNIAVGIVGGLLGGFILSLFGVNGITGFNLYSLLVALLGAIILLFIWSMTIGGGRKTVQ
ncbi:MAG TPA: GlsB/YeaQ/YmgE family stress response membrane protein [Candidatus Saccharimonadales bacterium]|nr:GlsB/YeaQ/YmgE family stress response membrane protein [Candidatus Saccharimonadales bacterium]